MPIDVYLSLLEISSLSLEEEIEDIVKLLKLYNIEPPAKILDLGCGFGRIAIELAKRGYKVVGIDRERTYIEKARESAQREGVSIEFIEVDARRLDKVFKKGEFDAILLYRGAVIGYHDKDEDRDILYKCYSIARPRGKLFMLRFPNKEYLSLLYGLLNYTALYRVYELTESMVVEERRFDPIESVETIVWRVYTRTRDSYIYSGSVEVSIHVYSVDELIDLARSVGWILEEVYGRLRPLQLYEEVPIAYTLNIIFSKAEVHS